MKEIIIVPIIGLMIIGFAVQLESIATQSGQKAINYASDMNNAMDCAMVGVPIKECSPNLMNTSFRPEITATTNLLENFSVTLAEELEDMPDNVTIDLSGINESEFNGTINIYVMV